MRPGSVLTTVDVEPEHQRLARAAYVSAGFPTSRYRLIGGLALEVLPRLADAAYDMVFCDADRQEFAAYLDGALRLLRPGGIVVFNAVLPGQHGQRADADATPRQLRRRSCASRSAPTSGSYRCCCPSATGYLQQPSRPEARLAGEANRVQAQQGCARTAADWLSRQRS